MTYPSQGVKEVSLGLPTQVLIDGFDRACQNLWSNNSLLLKFSGLYGSSGCIRGIRTLQNPKFGYIHGLKIFWQPMIVQANCMGSVAVIGQCEAPVMATDYLREKR
jgi:hypothetical protein